MPALDRAVALEQVHHIAEAVAEHLDLDVTGSVQVLLDQHPVIAERARSLAPGGGERVREVLRPPDHAHALAAAAG
jgi:hypothetical protein